MSRVKSLIRHIEKHNVYYAATECIFHTKRPCLTLLNKFNDERFHCLYANDASIWRYYSITKSCDIPDHFYDMILLNRQLGDEYVLPFASHFREYSGYTIGLYRQITDLYTPVIVDRGMFKRTVFAMIVFFVAVCHRLGGVTPSMKHFSFVYTTEHPVLCDIGGLNAEKKELINGEERFNKKKWARFLRGKKTLDIIRYLKQYYPNYFQKKKPGRRCILHDRENFGFDDETHSLVCKNLFLIDVLQEFKHLGPNSFNALIRDWVRLSRN